MEVFFVTVEETNLLHEVQRFGLVVVNQGNNDLIDIAGQNLLKLVKGQIYTMVGYPSLRVIIGSDTFTTITGTDQDLTFF